MSNPIKTTNKTVLTMFFAAVSLLILASCSSMRTGSNELKAKMVKPNIPQCQALNDQHCLFLEVWDVLFEQIR